MPNYCNFEMRVRGKRENATILNKWLSANYCYGDGIQCWEENEKRGKIPCEHHIGYRVFESTIDYDMSEDYFFIYGYCAWSVYSCMFEGEVGTYLGDYSNSRNKKGYAISLLDACRLLDLQVELFSEEPGCEFSEHYYIDKGEFVENNCVEFNEICVEWALDDEDYFNSLREKFKRLVKEAEANGNTEDWIRISPNIAEDGDWNWGYIL